MLTMSDVTRRTYEQRLDKLEGTAARLSGELVMASGHDPKAAERLTATLKPSKRRLSFCLKLSARDVSDSDYWIILDASSPYDAYRLSSVFAGLARTIPGSYARSSLRPFGNI